MLVEALITTKLQLLQKCANHSAGKLLGVDLSPLRIGAQAFFMFVRTWTGNSHCS